MRSLMEREGDVVLIHYRDTPAVFARIETIEPDAKKDWYQVTLLLLTIPTQTVTWILRESYIQGAPFTMGGRPVRLEAVPRQPPARESTGPGDGTETPGGNVIPFKRPK